MDKEEEVEELKPVAGLMDRHIIAALTGANPNSVRGWASRAAGTTPGAPPSWFPKMAGRLNNAPVFTAKGWDVEKAKASLRTVRGPVPKPKKDPSE